MARNKTFTAQLIVLGGFMLFLYIFFALATSIYRDYRLELQIEKFEAEVDKLAVLAEEKPKDVEYYQSDEYKDRYAKENLNLINPGEKVIIIPQDDQVVKRVEDLFRQKTPDEVLELPVHRQWFEYFFGQTLSVQATPKRVNEAPSENPVEENYNIDEEPLGS